MLPCLESYIDDYSGKEDEEYVADNVEDVPQRRAVEVVWKLVERLGIA